MNIVESLVKGALIPSLVAAGLLLGENFLRRGPVKQGSNLWALFFGFLIGYLLIVGEVAFPPEDGKAWVFWLALIGATWPFGVTVGGRPITLKLDGVKAFGIRVIVFGFLASGMLKPFLKTLWGVEQSAVAIAVVALAAAVIWWINERGVTSSRLSGALSLWLTALTGLSFLTVISGSALIGQLIGLLCAVLGVAFFWTLILPAKPLNPLIFSLVVFPLVGFVINVYYFVDADLSHVVIGLSPFVYGPPILARLVSRFPSRWIQAALGGALAAPAAAVAVYLAYQLHGFGY